LDPARRTFFRRGAVGVGHLTVAITLDTQMRVTPAVHREAARVVDAQFS